MGQAYAAPALEVVGPRRAFRAIINGHRLQHVRLNYGAYSADLRMRFPETEFTSQIFIIGGTAEAQISGLSTAISPDRGLVISPGQAFTVTNCSGGERLILMMNAAALANKLSLMTGQTCSTPLRFEPLQNYTQPMAKALRDHFRFLVEGVSAAPLPKLALDEFEHILMMMFLHANRHNYSHLLDRAPQHAAEQQVRRVEDFIAANWKQAITLADLVEISGVSALSLCRSFRKSRGFTPMEMVKRLRLEHARDLLLHPSREMTLADIASICGFIDVGQFACAYVDAFGERPSETLDRSKGNGRHWH